MDDAAATRLHAEHSLLVGVTLDGISSLRDKIALFAYDSISLQQLDHATAFELGFLLASSAGPLYRHLTAVAAQHSNIMGIEWAARCRQYADELLADAPRGEFATLMNVMDVRLEHIHEHLTLLHDALTLRATAHLGSGTVLSDVDLNSLLTQ